jgi:hypothetical protein
MTNINIGENQVEIVSLELPQLNKYGDGNHKNRLVTIIDGKEEVDFHLQTNVIIHKNLLNRLIENKRFFYPGKIIKFRITKELIDLLPNHKWLNINRLLENPLRIALLQYKKNDDYFNLLFCLSDQLYRYIKDFRYIGATEYKSYENWFTSNQKENISSLEKIIDSPNLDPNQKTTLENFLQEAKSLDQKIEKLKCILNDSIVE